MKRRVGAIVIGPVVAAALAMPAQGQEETKLEPVVVTATKIETPSERLGAAVTVISEDDIRAYRWETVGDALRHVPGVDVQRSGTLGKTTTLRIRGATPQQVQVLVDGVRAKSPTAGLVELADIAIDQIERIEVVRGPQSTIYGADAIGGVVNIITKRGRGPFSSYASLEAGNDDTHRERAGFSGSAGIFDYSLGGSWFASQGQLPNDATEQGAVSTRLGLTLPRDGHLGVSSRYTSTASELPLDGLTPTPQSPFFLLDPNADQDSDTLTLALEWTHKPVAWFEARARYGVFWNWLTFRDPATPEDAAAGNQDLLFGATRSRIDTNRQEVEVVTAWHAGKWNTLTVGGEYQTESGTIDSVSGGFATELDERLHTTSWFVQDELRLFDRLILSAGRRWDDHSSFGDVATDRASAVLLIRETGTKLRGTWGEGFRAPTINDLFFPGFANPDLEPERSESWDAGVDQRLWRDRVRLGATYFHNHFRNLIQLTFDASQCPPGNPFGCPINVGRARTEGLEVSVAVDLLDTLTLSGGYTYTDTEDLATNRPLRRFPRHRYTAGLTWEPVNTVSLFAEAQVVSSQFEQEGLPSNPGHHRIDVGGVWRIAPRRGTAPALDLTVRVNNVTDEDYMEVLGFPAPGINFLAGLQARY
ncbi:MAG TPA: TonB-dependent receptor [Methylomirabilota bacterium]|nr:TonB-dependent receptor [Methylomirabilota bacterium]